ncbi:nephrin-like [Ischnura elegans]|uniref:nephrin-like n=1 Tax=Ischnura elegans TaxID=197161 RepID=UPI001ED8B632|nr:nephrin-like [Ischnura elegans]
MSSQPGNVRRLAPIVVLLLASLLHVCLPQEAADEEDNGGGALDLLMMEEEEDEEAWEEDDWGDYEDEEEEGEDGEGERAGGGGNDHNWTHEEDAAAAWNAGNGEDADDAPVSTVSVEAVVGRSVGLPCDIEPTTPADRVYMVLWFRESAGKPMYSFDVRGRAFAKAKLWSDEHAFGPRAYFVTVSRPAQLTLDAVIEEDEGAYRCRVDFKNSPTRNSIVNLTVIVPPTDVRITKSSGEELQGSTLGPFFEGDDVILDCYAIGGKPPPTVSWFVQDKLVSGIHEERHPGRPMNRLEIRNLRRSHLNATLKCQASNTKLAIPSEKSVKLDMLLRPLSVRLLNKPVQLRANKEYQVTCEAVGSRPRPVFSWYKDGRKVKKSKWHESGNETVAVSVLTITPIPDDDRHQVKCHAHNPYISSSGYEDILNLNVLYAPQVSLKLGSSLNPDEIKEGDDVYFECQVRANPREQKILWKHEETLLVQNTSAGVIMSGSSLVLQRVRRRHAGNYRCAASNSEGDSTSDQVRLRVQFAPICATGGPPSAEGGHVDQGIMVVGASLEERLSVRCEVSADPPDVAFSWQFSNSGEGFEVPSGRHASSNGTVSVLAYTPRTDHDYGTLSCLGANAIGRQAAPCLFQVVPAGRPAPLSNCTLGNRSTDWAEVECAPGFDGGLPQFFLLEAYDARTSRLRLNVTRNDAPLFRLTDLAPGSSLRLLLYAANAKGHSEPTVLEDVSLWDAEERTESVSAAGSGTMGALPLLALLLGVLLALSSMTLVAAMAARHRRNADQPSLPSGEVSVPPLLYPKAPPPEPVPSQQLHHHQEHQLQHQMEQPRLETNRGGLMVSYTLKADNNRAEWSSGNILQGQNETPAPDILVDKHYGLGVSETGYPLRHCSGLQMDHRDPMSRVALPNHISHPSAVHSSLYMEDHSTLENIQEIPRAMQDRTTNFLPWPKGREENSSFVSYELNGKFIKEQLLSDDVPESCV